MNIRDTPMLQIRFKKGKVVKKIGRGEIRQGLQGYALKVNKYLSIIWAVWVVMAFE